MNITMLVILTLLIKWKEGEKSPSFLHFLKLQYKHIL
jgi:hypothetical protein